MKATKATKQNRKKAFTLVELVIVIAVIAILAAVLIPTFSSVINSAKNSADQQLVYNLNDIAATQQPFSNNNEFELADNIRKVLDEEGGYGKDRLVTKNSDAIIVYDTQSQKFERVKLNEHSNGLVAFAEEDSADPYYLEEIFAGQIIISTGGNTLAEAIYNLHNLPNDVTGNYVAENYNKIPNDLKDTVKTILENSIMVTANGNAVAITFNGETPSVGEVTEHKAKIIFSEEATTVNLGVAANNMPEKVIIPNNITSVAGNLANTQVAGNTTVVMGETAGNCTIQQARGEESGSTGGTPDIDTEHKHDYTGVEPTWNFENGKATATFQCKTCDDSETVTTETLVEETEASATCTEDRTFKYKAVVNFNEKDYTGYSDVLTEENSKLGHSYTGDLVKGENGQHSYACVNGECGTTGATESCTYKNYTNNGDTHTGKCECGNTDTDSHEWNDWFDATAAGHVYKCTAEGCTATDTKEHTTDYQDITDYKHTAYCTTTNCSYEETVDHDFGSDGDRHDCVCGELLCVEAKSGEYTINASDYATENKDITSGQNTSATIDFSEAISITFKHGSTNTNTRWWANDQTLRMYAGSSFTINSVGDITKIEFSGYTTGMSLADENGSFRDGTWNGKSSSVTFKAASSDVKIEIKSITITYEAQPAVGHHVWKATDKIEAANCEHGTKTEYECIRCGETYVNEADDKTNDHKYNENGICDVCGGMDPAKKSGSYTIEEPSSFTTSYKQYAWTVSDEYGTISGTMYAYKNGGMQFNTNQTAYYIASQSGTPAPITKIKVTTSGSTAARWALYTSGNSYDGQYGKTTPSGTPHGTQSGATSVAEWELTGSDTYFALVLTGSGASVITSVVIEYGGGSTGGGTTNPEPTDPEVKPGGYTLVTSVDQLGNSAEIIIVSGSGSGSKAMSITQNNNNRAATNVTNEDGAIVPDDDVALIKLEKVSGGYTLYVTNGNNTGYLYAAGGTGNNNYLRTQTTLTAPGYWTIEINTSNQATITTADSTVARHTIMNNGDLFSCYASGQTPVQIYMKAA